MFENRKVRGSALYLDDGGLIFTPYNQNPQKSIWKKALMVSNGKMRSTNEIVQITLTARKDATVSKTLMNAFNNMTPHPVPVTR